MTLQCLAAQIPEISGCTPLHWAAHNGLYRDVEILLNSGGRGMEGGASRMWACASSMQDSRLFGCRNEASFLPRRRKFRINMFCFWPYVAWLFLKKLTRLVDQAWWSVQDHALAGNKKKLLNPDIVRNMTPIKAPIECNLDGQRCHGEKTSMESFRHWNMQNYSLLQWPRCKRQCYGQLSWDTLTYGSTMWLCGCLAWILQHPFCSWEPMK